MNSAGKIKRFREIRDFEDDMFNLGVLDYKMKKSLYTCVHPLDR